GPLRLLLVPERAGALGMGSAGAAAAGGRLAAAACAQPPAAPAPVAGPDGGNGAPAARRPAGLPFAASAGHPCAPARPRRRVGCFSLPLRGTLQAPAKLL